MSRYHVFLGAPTAHELLESDKEFTFMWLHATDNPSVMNYTIPPATLEEAHRRISKLYADINFDDDSEQAPNENLLEIDSLNDTRHPGTLISTCLLGIIDGDFRSR